MPSQVDRLYGSIPVAANNEQKSGCVLQKSHASEMRIRNQSITPLENRFEAK